MIRLDGYTDVEKVAIARDHLLPRQIRGAGLEPEEIDVTELEPPAVRDLGGQLELQILCPGVEDDEEVVVLAEVRTATRGLEVVVVIGPGEGAFATAVREAAGRPLDNLAGTDAA